MGTKQHVITTVEALNEMRRSAKEAMTVLRETIDFPRRDYTIVPNTKYTHAMNQIQHYQQIIDDTASDVDDYLN